MRPPKKLQSLPDGQIQGASGWPVRFISKTAPHDKMIRDHCSAEQINETGIGTKA